MELTMKAEAAVLMAPAQLAVKRLREGVYSVLLALLHWKVAVARNARPENFLRGAAVRDVLQGLWQSNRVLQRVMHALPGDTNFSSSFAMSAPQVFSPSLETAPVPDALLVFLLLSLGAAYAPHVPEAFSQKKEVPNAATVLQGTFQMQPVVLVMLAMQVLLPKTLSLVSRVLVEPFRRLPATYAAVAQTGRCLLRGAPCAKVVTAYCYGQFQMPRSRAVKF